ncbi:putative thebaine 6-O-demethylase [Helianthus anomalus]
MTLFGIIGQALDIDKGEMLDIFEDGMQSVRMTYYPPCPQPDLVVGLTPHSDAAGITILLQVNDVEGLQVKKDGMWIPVNFLPDAFVVNVGDILEVSPISIHVEHFSFLFIFIIFPRDVQWFIKTLAYLKPL